MFNERSDMMKKVVLSLVGACFIFAGCSQDDSVEVPILPEMTLENEQTTEEIDPNAPTATYSVDDMSYEEVLKEYETKLVKEGWTVTLDGKPDFLSLEKKNRLLKIMPVQLEDSILVHMYEEEIE